jgi:hypothetical protein
LWQGDKALMLEQLPRRDAEETIHRLASKSKMRAFLERQGFDFDSIKEQIELLREFEALDDPNHLLNAPFEPKHTIDRNKIDPTRYSDGTYQVFYGALEAETAKTEIKYHYGQLALGDPNKRRTVYYMHFTCRLNGVMKDLREKQEEWPLLVEKDRSVAYPFCNPLGKEAVLEGLDGLYAPSAREAGGTCTPVFQRRALSSPNEEALVALSYRGDSGEIHVDAAPVR